MESNNFSSKLKYFLDVKKIKPSELAKSSGLSESLISQYLNNKINPKNDKIIIIAQTLDIDPIELIEIDNNAADTTSSKKKDALRIIRRASSKMSDNQIDDMMRILTDEFNDAFNDE